MGVWEEAGWGWWGGQGPAPHVLMKSWTPRGDCRRAASLLQPLPGVQATRSPVRGSCPRSSLWPLLGPLPLPLDTPGPAWKSLGLALPGETPRPSPHRHVSAVPDIAHTQPKSPTTQASQEHKAMEPTLWVDHRAQLLLSGFSYLSAPLPQLGAPGG